MAGQHGSATSRNARPGAESRTRPFPQNTVKLQLSPSPALPPRASRSGGRTTRRARKAWKLAKVSISFGARVVGGEARDLLGNSNNILGDIRSAGTLRREGRMASEEGPPGCCQDPRTLFYSYSPGPPWSVARVQSDLDSVRLARGPRPLVSSKPRSMCQPPGPERGQLGLQALRAASPGKNTQKRHSLTLFCACAAARPEAEVCC